MQNQCQQRTTLCLIYTLSDNDLGISVGIWLVGIEDVDGSGHLQNKQTNQNHCVPKLLNDKFIRVHLFKVFISC